MGSLQAAWHLVQSCKRRDPTGHRMPASCGCSAKLMIVLNDGDWTGDCRHGGGDHRRVAARIPHVSISRGLYVLAPISFPTTTRHA